MSIISSLGLSYVFFLNPNMDVSLFSDLANKNGDWFIFWWKFWPASLLYSVLFSVFLKMYLLIVILWRKSTRECFICSKLHLSRVVPRQWRPPVTSARTVIKRNFYVCAKLKKNSPNWCFWGPSGYHQMNPSSRCANRANSAIYSWHINSWLVIMDWLYLSPPKALQIPPDIVFYFAICLFLHAIGVRDEWPTPDRMKYCWSAFDFQIAKLFLLTLGKAHLSYV